MGEVYRATDTNLKRQVALKVLPESFASDADRVARFQREAEVLAALNHPHIAQIYGIERAAGVTTLVMELVEGEDLSQRIVRGPVPLDEARPIARQIAEALEAAHEQGIVHRDLKPANVKVRAAASAAGGAAGGQWQVSTSGGIVPVWRSDGKELYYLNPAGAMMAAPIVVRGDTLEQGAPELVFQTRIVGSGTEAGHTRQYDVAPDGRFLINTELDDSAAPITLLMNWNPDAKR